MATHNAKNELIKRDYFAYLAGAKGNCDATVDDAAAALARFEAFTKFQDFKSFSSAQAIGFKRHLETQRNKVNGQALSEATQHAVLAHARHFFQWLVGQPGYKSRLVRSDADFLRLSMKDARAATARREKNVPTIEQVKLVIAGMPVRTDVERRNRAVVAFELLTGTRVTALASLNLGHVDLTAGCVRADARDVKTKSSKTFTSYFFPVGDEIRAIVERWVTELRVDKRWQDDDPLFPSTRMVLGSGNRFQIGGLKPKHWSTAAPIREIFRKAFLAAGLPYFHPHAVRDVLVTLGYALCRTPEELKAWSQNLGHEEVLTTLYNYGRVANRRQSEILRSLTTRTAGDELETIALMKALLRRLE